MIYFRCGKCATGLEVPDSLAAMKETCPSCGTVNHVPVEGVAGEEPVQQTECLNGLLDVEGRRHSKWFKLHLVGWPNVLLGVIIITFGMGRLGNIEQVTTGQCWVIVGTGVLVSGIIVTAVGSLQTKLCELIGDHTLIRKGISAGRHRNGK